MNIKVTDGRVQTDLYKKNQQMLLVFYYPGQESSKTPLQTKIVL